METGNSTWGDQKFDYEVFTGIETIIFFCYKQHNLSILLLMAMWVVSILWYYKHHCSKLTCVSWCTGIRVILRLWFSLKSPAESSLATDPLFPSQTNYMTDSKYGQKWGKWGKWRMGGAWEGGMSSIFFNIQFVNYSNSANCPKMYFIPIFLYFPPEDPVSVHILHLVGNLCSFLI